MCGDPKFLRFPLVGIDYDLPPWGGWPVPFPRARQACPSEYALGGTRLSGPARNIG